MRHDSVAVITGASSGIGAATARLAEGGAGTGAETEDPHIAAPAA